MSTFDTFAEQLARLAPETPDQVPVVSLDPHRDQVGHGLELAHRLGESLGLDLQARKIDRGATTTVLYDEAGGRVRVFHASGAVALRSRTEPFEELFDADPGDERLISMTTSWADKLTLPGLVPDTEKLTFERLWRLKAAGSDPEGRLSEPVLTRAVGAFRHQLHDLPVLGRASAHVEVTGAGSVSALSVSLRRWAGEDEKVLATVRPKSSDDAAREVADRVAKMVGGSEDGELVPESFAYGYLSLGRRRAQSVLAPLWIASVSIVGVTRSAHLIAVAGSQETFLKLPVGARAAASQRGATLRAA
jgi:hypothetical protein